MVQTQEVERLLVDAETGVRGYLVTGSESFLEPYTHAQELINGKFDSLAILVADNPEQSVLMKLLGSDLQQWNTYARQSIAQRRYGKEVLEAETHVDGTIVRVKLPTIVGSGFGNVFLSFRLTRQRSCTTDIPPKNFLG